MVLYTVCCIQTEIPSLRKMIAQQQALSDEGEGEDGDEDDEEGDDDEEGADGDDQEDDEDEGTS